MTGYTKAYRARASKVAALITKNPELPIFAEVDSEVVADDGYNTWFGEMRGAYIDRTGDPQVDREICRMVDSWGMKTAENDKVILISWAGGAEAC